MVWCFVQNWLENGVNSMDHFITWYLCDHLCSSAVDVYNWKTIVLIFFASIMKYLISDFQNSSILTWMVTMILKLALNLLAPLHVCGPVWAQLIRVSGRLTSLVCLCQCWPGGSWKGYIWELERDFLRKMAKFNICLDLLRMLKNSIQEGSPGAAFLESMSNMSQSQLKWLGEIGLSVMCRTSDVVPWVKKVKWVSSFLHLFPCSAGFEQLNPVGWRSQGILPPLAVSSCSISLFLCPASSKANHKFRTCIYTYIHMASHEHISMMGGQMAT